MGTINYEQVALDLAMNVLRSAAARRVSHKELVWQAWRLICDADHPNMEEASKLIGSWVLGVGLEAVELMNGGETAADGYFTIDLTADSLDGLMKILEIPIEPVTPHRIETDRDGEHSKHHHFVEGHDSGHEEY